MQRIGLLFGILLSLGAICIAVSEYRNFREDITKAHQRLTKGSNLLTTSHGTIEYATVGKGDPVIVVHGAGGGYDQGLIISVAWVGNDYHRIAVSRFGYLRSPLPADPSPFLQADILAELLDSLDIKQAVIMGASAGGPSVIQFALRHPARCNAVILVSAITRAHPPLSWYQNLAGDIIFNSDLLYWSLISYLPSSFYTTFGIPPEVQATLSPGQRDSISYFLHSIVPISLRKNGTLHDRIVHDLDFPIEQIQTPVLVIHALDDNIVPYANAEHIKEKIPDARLLAFETGGHLLIGQYHHIKQTITDFLVRSRHAGDNQ